MKDFKNSVVYQIYPKSFNDSNNDGLGDLRGVVEKLDYLEGLGVDYIWLTPFFVSPQNDNGYDIADYYNIDPAYGTMEDFEALVEGATKRNIKIMLDMVFNHTSTHHVWFQKALQGDSKYKNYYIFRKGENGNPPTNWVSKFGGNAWEYVEQFDEYYLHLFDVTQADLNWENPELRQEVYNVVNFWIEKGVKGFRLDVINLISKPDLLENDYIGDGRRFYTDGPRIHQYLKELNENTFGKHEDIITVGEMSSTTIENCLKYSNPDEKELSMVFNFHHLKVDYKDGDKWKLKEFDFAELKDLLNTWQTSMMEGNGWNAVFWCNHDQPRIVSRLGDDKNYHEQSAKMLATAIHCLRGTPYIYQGEEIGMTNPYFNDINKYRDVESLNYYNILREQGHTEEETYDIIMARSRDNSRTPMQWNSDVNAGFSEGTPWIGVIDNYETINVERNLSDENSIYNHYKKLIHLRKQYNVIADGTYEPMLVDHEAVYAYRRLLDNEVLMVLNNFYGKDTTVTLNIEDFDDYTCLLSNYESQNLTNQMTLRPYESIIFYKKTK
ncbi:alpha,alpha-phosphotrehalase [Turicibacter bilis]|uniref:Alpha,alpha-phosphotrehalase n=1 Tax=Turicibacter bilis TaxID=2735723 RepID=A0A9Q9CM96_9FIRM|nr:alpha,alpha-phosphotrehalase [Turicibacter bilis]MBS3197257.1 alpha,alpha-phosphotrehalase [Turicibacter bilis]UUF09129.1 alpha,alpha-phosphotrehalase [Turicibacter bilis]